MVIEVNYGCSSESTDTLWLACVRATRFSPTARAMPRRSEPFLCSILTRSLSREGIRLSPPEATCHVAASLDGNGLETRGGMPLAQSRYARRALERAKAFTGVGYRCERKRARRKKPTTNPTDVRRVLHECRHRLRAGENVEQANEYEPNVEGSHRLSP